MQKNETGVKSGNFKFVGKGKVHEFNYGNQAG